jgi:hypothetical protein
MFSLLSDSVILGGTGCSIRSPAKMQSTVNDALIQYGRDTNAENRADGEML